jgi:hypothetical protein
MASTIMYFGAKQQEGLASQLRSFFHTHGLEQKNHTHSLPQVGQTQDRYIRLAAIELDTCQFKLIQYPAPLVT